MKKLFRIIIILFGILLAAAILLFAALVITEYRPSDVEAIVPEGTLAGQSVRAGEDLTFLTWNIGYAALGKDSDFVMDGGGKVPAANRETVGKYLDGIKSTVASNSDADILMFQEVDASSSRSFRINECEALSKGIHSYALNYSCIFVPFPWPPFGTVNSGLLTTSDYDMSSAERIALPCPFSWPVSAANLKRCLLVSRFPVEGSEKELVVVNLHLEAYAGSEGKRAQAEKLKDFIVSEFEKGNYVIAGGDFNQLFPGSVESYPNVHTDLWDVPLLDEADLEKGFSYICDLETPSCRLLNQPYDPSDTANTQYYVIDGFIVSPNVQVNSVETLDAGFEYSDHNPVKLSAVLLPEN